MRIIFHGGSQDMESCIFKNENKENRNFKLKKIKNKKHIFKNFMFFKLKRVFQITSL